MKSNKYTLISVPNILFIMQLLNNIYICRNVMTNKNKIDQSILDDDDEDDFTIMGRESISSLFVRACGMGHEEVFEDQPGDCTPSSSAHTPLAKPGFPHAYYLARRPQELAAGN